MKVFYLCEAYGHGFQEDGYMAADEAVEFAFDEEWEGLTDWLEENIKGKYDFDRDYTHVDTMEVRVDLILFFEDIEDATAFKLKWL